MRVAINARFLLSDYLEGYGYFQYETLKRIVKNHPQDEFIFIFDRPYNPEFIFAANVTPVVAGPPARHPLLWKWWYDVKVPAVLKKYKADIFLSTDGFCSLRTKIPQCLVVHDLSFLHYPALIKKSHHFFYKKYTPLFLKKAKSIATVSQFSKEDIVDRYHTDEDKIAIIYSAAKTIFQPLSDSEKNSTRDKYTEGYHYFVYAGAIHPRKNLLNLLKAFSIFKKRQKSSWKLVIAGRLAWKYDSFLKSIESYKYRKDVVMTGYVEETELVKIIGSAYALVYPSLWEGFGVPVLEAMQCQVPVITSSKSSMQEIAEEAALYADPEDYAAIADKMMALYKDETLRSQLIEKGSAIAREYSWDKTADLLWQAILKAAR